MATLTFDRKFFNNVLWEMRSKGYRINEVTINDVIVYVKSQIK